MSITNDNYEKFNKLTNLINELREALKELEVNEDMSAKCNHENFVYLPMFHTDIKKMCKDCYLVFK